MPELPEVEAARRLVDRNCKGKRITSAQVETDEKVFDGISASELKAKLEGATIASTGRRAKYFWLSIERAGGLSTLILHFGMTGDVMIKKSSGDIEKMDYQSSKDQDKTLWPPRFLKLELVLSDGTRMAFTDSRRFARVRWINEGNPEEIDPSLKKLAPDAFTSLPTFENWQAQLSALGLRKKALKIKAMLLDQEEVVSGIGNWLADEILYQARVHPEQPVSTMTLEQSSAVFTKTRDIVTFSCSVDADYLQFPSSWLFHYRWTGKKASSIDGKSISFVTVGSRTSAFVPSLQKVTGAPREAKVKKVKEVGEVELQPQADATVKSVKAGSKKRSATAPSLPESSTGDEVAAANKLPSKRKTRKGT